MSRISTKSLIQLSRRLGTSMRAGVEARKLWETEARHATGPLRRYVDQVKNGVLRGESVADSMRSCDGYFPPLVCEMVEVGEKTGHLDAVFFKLADHYEHQQQMTRGFLFGIAWPLFQLIFAVFVIGGLIGILGVISQVRPGGPELDVLGLGLTGVTGMIFFWAICGMIFLAIGLGLIALMRGWFGAAPVMFAMKIPGIGNALQSLALARLTWALAMSLEAGIDAKRSVQLSLRAAQNPYYQAHERQMVDEIVANRQFHEAFAAPGVFPSEFLHALENAELAGATAESLLLLSRDYEERAKNVMKWLAWILGIIIWLMVGGLMVLMIFRLAWAVYFKPMYDIMDDLQHGRV